jgi:glycosyltransferase involved in cell wall biosynthesis
MNLNKLADNVLVLTHWSFKDALVQTYTLPYVNIIRSILPLDRKIILVTSEQKSLALTEKETQTINEDWLMQNMMLLPLPYQAMGIKKMIVSVNHLQRLYRLIRKENVLTIHCFCTPAGSIGYLLSNLSGAKLIIDSYEPHAESMVENGTWGKKSFAFRLLFLFEKLQSQRATCFVSTSAGMKAYAKQKYGLDIQRFFVKPACVDLDKFPSGNRDGNLLDELNLRHKIVCVYAGKLGGIYLKEEVFDFIFECYRHWGDQFRFLMLTNASKEEVQEELKRVGVPEHVIIQKFAKHEDVPKYLSLGDFAINPVRPIPTKRYCTSIKDGEYWATGLPVVITRNISDDSDIIAHNKIGYVLNSLDSAEYKNAIVRIEQLMNDHTDTTRQKIRSVAKKYRSFQIAEKIYKEIYS